MTALNASTEYFYSVGDEPLPGYRLLSPLGRGGFGEVWKCVAPGGLHKAIKFVPEDGKPDTVSSLVQEYEAFQRVKDIRHPFLLTLERVELIDDVLMMVMELADQSLAQRFDECRAAGMRGIPRSELLSYMVDAAEALDVLGWEHGLQHLDVKPANLFLVGGHAKVGDYGLVARCVRSGNGEELQLSRGLTPRYVAPEILDGKVDSRSDQYPLALVYQELLTGVLPYPGPSAQHLLVQHKVAAPNVSPLPNSDREVVERALAKNPANRYPSCLEFVKALMRDVSNTPAPAHSSTPLATPAPRRSSPSMDSGGEQTVRLVSTQGDLTGLTTTLKRGSDDLSRTCPGYQLVSEISQGLQGRRIRANDPAGQAVHIQLLRLDGGSTADLDHVIRVASIPHERLWQTVLAAHSRCVGFVTAESHMTLEDWIHPKGRPTPRALGVNDATKLLTPVAAALDELTRRANFGHLLINPSNLLIADEKCGIARFGVAELFRLSRTDLDWLADDPFVAPEVVAGRPSPTSDQYSLALVYLNLVGAWQPTKRGRGERGTVDWTVLPRTEREAVRRAISSDPNARFPSCTKFFEAATPPPSSGPVLEEVRWVESVDRLLGRSGTVTTPPDASVVTAAVVRAAETASGQPNFGAKPLTLPDGRVAIRFPVKWTPGFSNLKSAAFKDQYRYKVIPLAADTTLFKPSLDIGTKSNTPPVELVVRWPLVTTAGMGEVLVTGRYTLGLDPHRGVEQVAAVLDLFRRSIQNTSDRRKAPRVATDLAVTLYPVGDDLQIAPPITGKCRDVSATGFAALIPGTAPMVHVFVAFPTVAEVAGSAILAQLVRIGTPDATEHTLVAGRFVHAGEGK